MIAIVGSQNSKASVASVTAPYPKVKGLHWTERLKDGTPVLIRPLRPEDRQREEDFINGLSPMAKRFRFMGEFKRASSQLLDMMMDVDYPQRIAFIALAHENGKLREVGVSRYSATSDTKHCECAVIVSEDWQNRGLDVLLMTHLINIARENGYREMFSIDDAKNLPMRDLARYLGFDRRPDPQDIRQVIHSLDL